MSDDKYGPRTAQVQAIIDRARRLTKEDFQRPDWVAFGVASNAAYAAREAVWGDIRYATRYAACDEAAYVAWGATSNAAYAAGEADREAARYAAIDAALAECAKDLISEEHYNTLMAPWRVLIGDSKAADA